MHHEVRENRLIMINGQRNGISPSISLFSYGDRSPRLGLRGLEVALWRRTRQRKELLHSHDFLVNNDALRVVTLKEARSILVKRRLRISYDGASDLHDDE